MSDTDNPSNENGEHKNEKPVKTFAGVLKQVQTELDKNAANSVKTQAQELLKKKSEHERSIRQIDAQLDELGAKFDKGIL